MLLLAVIVDMILSCFYLSVYCIVRMDVWPKSLQCIIKGPTYTTFVRRVHDIIKPLLCTLTVHVLHRTTTTTSVATNTSTTVFKYLSKYCSLYQYLNAI